MLIGSTITRLDIPHEPGQWVEVRKLNHRTLAKAAQVRADAGIVSMKSLGGDLLEAIQKARKDENEQPKSDVDAGYDRDTVLQAGVNRWSYDAPVTPDTLGDLDDITARWLAHEIISRSVAPPSPEALGNVTAPSTAS